MVADNVKNIKIGFIGAGNMAKAIGGGLLKNEIIDKSQLAVSAPSRRNYEWWTNIGVKWIQNSDDLCKECDIIFLAMKPQTFSAAIASIKGSFPNKLWVSILAGVTLETLSDRLTSISSTGPSVIRVMPNTPMSIGHGCSVFCGNSHTQRSDADRMLTILGCLGKTFEEKEELIDAISSIIGNSPAYIYVIIEAMADAGVKMGIGRELSYQLAAQTVVGAGQMVLQTGTHPGLLKDQVTSPGGSTIAGLHVLERNNVRAAIMDTLETAAEKNKELGKLSSNR